MPITWLTGENARWEVIWWNKKKKRFTVMPFGDDLAEAEALYRQVVQAAKPFATLRCCNVGFPPPEKYRPYTHTERVRTGTKIVKRSVKGKVKRYRKVVYKEVEHEVIPMIEVNLKGVWWCPYCRQLRKFRKQDGMTLSDRGHDYYLDGTVYCCPVCRITHRNHHVRKWNPQAQKMPFRQKATRARRSNGRATRRRTRKR